MARQREELEDIAEGKDKRAIAKAKKAERAAKKAEKKKKKSSLEEKEEGSRLGIFLVTATIILVWIAIIAVLIKMDVGGFGSAVLTPLLKDVPVINKILPESEEIEAVISDENYPYATLAEALQQIKHLELELQAAEESKGAVEETVAGLQAELEKLRIFESSQIQFETQKSEFYNDVVFTDNAPDIAEYKKYYESIDPAYAESLYKQVIQQMEYSDEVVQYAKAYGEMKPAQAAKIFEAMTGDMELAAKILENINAEARGKILGAMDPAVAARLTKVMAP